MNVSLARPAWTFFWIVRVRALRVPCARLRAPRAHEIQRARQKMRAWVAVAVAVVALAVVAAAYMSKPPSERFEQPQCASAVAETKCHGVEAIDEYRARLYAIQIIRTVLRRQPTDAELDKYGALKTEPEVLRAIVRDNAVVMQEVREEGECPPGGEVEDDGFEYLTSDDDEPPPRPAPAPATPAASTPASSTPASTPPASPPRTPPKTPIAANAASPRCEELVRQAAREATRDAQAACLGDRRELQARLESIGQDVARMRQMIAADALA
jgi:pyruvate/2-oxoglutarate dehydrogenase complex dihydrolipoamide acyltransferase (E2) component